MGRHIWKALQSVGICSLCLSLLPPRNKRLETDIFSYILRKKCLLIFMPQLPFTTALKQNPLRSLGVIKAAFALISRRLLVIARSCAADIVFATIADKIAAGNATSEKT